MTANLASIQINGKTLKKGTSVTLDFGMGPMTEEVFDIFMDGNKEITIETVTSFGCFHKRSAEQFEDALV